MTPTSPRIAVALAAAALLVSVAALVVAVIALTSEAPGPEKPAPTKDEPGAYTKAVVKDAIQRYKQDGLQATVDYYNSIESVDGEWYVFIIDGRGYTISHHNPQFRNRDPSLRVDAAGRFYGDDLLGATEDGRWVNYVILNPESAENDQKHTWAVRARRPDIRLRLVRTLGHSLQARRYRRHSAIFHSSLSQPLIRTSFSVFRCADT